MTQLVSYVDDSMVAIEKLSALVFVRHINISLLNTSTMGRRNTARTGDKALYNSRPSRLKNHESRIADEEFVTVANASDGDKSVGEDESASDSMPVLQNVMDLGVEEQSDSSDESSEEEEKQDVRQRGVDAEDSSFGSSSDDEDASLDQNIDSSRWGKKKSLYYHGDTADIEIGQDREDAFDEEKAAKEIESSRFQVMDEDDFIIEDHFDNESGRNTIHLDVDSKITSYRDVSNLSSKEKRRFIKNQHPELLPLVSHFSDLCRDCRETTSAVKALLNGSADVIKVSKRAWCLYKFSLVSNNDSMIP